MLLGHSDLAMVQRHSRICTSEQVVDAHSYVSINFRSGRPKLRRALGATVDQAARQQIKTARLAEPGRVTRTELPPPEESRAFGARTEEEAMIERELDLTPSPRILRMLGQVDFKHWQCLAELIDNSVDAFITARDESSGMLFPQVNVEVSSHSDIKRGTGTIKVSDNGPGMVPEFLEQAARAGFSGNDPVGKLGLFGMGFNVATARLGSRTEVWTTRAEDEEWHGLRIDFDEMENSNSYLVPALTRRKTAAEREIHGTEVIISKLDKDRALYLRSGAGGRATREHLERVYNMIMREIDLKVIIGDVPLQPRDFCIWGDTRFVETKTEFGRIPARIEIHEDLGKRNYCSDCWAWLLDSDPDCPICGSMDNVTPRSRTVRGWIGVQRFFDQTNYGIDLIRNGRVIEERSKVFFSWTNSDTGDVTPEYPLEQTHWGGRLVGELAIDFVPLGSHQKDAFDHRTPEWRLVEKVVRGDGPILTKARQALGLGPREDSPLARLHTGYRRGSPAGLRHLVPGDPTGKGINVEPQRWADLFWDKDPEYQTDAKWWDAVIAAETAKSEGSGADIPGDLQGPPDPFEAAEAEDEPETSAASSADTPRETAAERLAVPSLTGTFALADIPGSPTLDVTTEELVSGQLPLGLHIEFSAAGSRVDITYNPRHKAFTESLLEPVDCLVEELAYQFLQRSAVSQAEWPISRITQLLREKYFTWSVSTYPAVRLASEGLLSEMVEFYTEALAGISPLELDVVTDAERSIIARGVARAEHAGDERTDEVIRSGEFPRYLGGSALPGLIERWPELAFDGKFFVVAYASADAALRGELMQLVANPIHDLLWIVNPEANRFYGDEWRSLLARSSASLRLLESWKV